MRGCLFDMCLPALRYHAIIPINGRNPGNTVQNLNCTAARNNRDPGRRAVLEIRDLSMLPMHISTRSAWSSSQGSGANPTPEVDSTRSNQEAGVRETGCGSGGKSPPHEKWSLPRLHSRL